jgi:hypothetical protein
VVPANANSVAFDFAYFSKEWGVSQKFDDRFVALLASAAWSGNMAHDAKNACLAATKVSYAMCKSCPAGEAGLAGTGFDGGQGASTGWLTAAAPVKPGETIKLDFVLHDESDGKYDTTVLLDGFRWSGKKLTGPSVTTK